MTDNEFIDEMSNIDSLVRVTVMYEGKTPESRFHLKNARKRLSLLKKKVDSQSEATFNDRECKKDRLSNMFCADECIDDLAEDLDIPAGKNVFVNLSDEYPNLFGKKSKRAVKQTAKRNLLGKKTKNSKVRKTKDHIKTKGGFGKRKK